MSEQKVETLAVLDYLTLLPNRSGLYSFYAGLSSDEYVTTMFLDIDNFKRVNDTYGHGAGDDLLVAVTKELQKIVADTYLARIGGDEFVMMFLGKRERAEVEKMAERVCSSTEELEVSSEVQAVISFSVGVIMNEKASVPIDNVLFMSDAAMYHAKKSGKNAYVMYDTIQDEMERRLIVEKEMKSALEEGEFQVYLKPLMNAVSSCIHGAESAVRWIRKNGEVWNAGKFLQIMDENGFVVEVERFVYEQVCKIKNGWKNTELETLKIGINLSRRHLFRKHFVDELVEVANRYEVPTGELVIEITEMQGEDKSILIKTVKELQKAGFEVAIDNFGTESSSISLLADVPADIIKLDKGLLEDHEFENRRKVIVKNLLSMAKGIHMMPIMDGISSYEQEYFIVSHGCDVVEGDYYSKAMPLDDFLEFFEENKLPQFKEIEYRFLGDLKDQNGANEGAVSGEIHYAEGIIDSVGSVHFIGGEHMKNIVYLPRDVLGDESYTISMWVKADRLNNWTSILMAYADRGFISVIPYGWERVPVFRLHDSWNDADGWYDALGVDICANEWVHLCVTYNAVKGLIRIYQNGKLQGKVDNVVEIRNHKIITLGGDRYQDTFEGYCSDLRIVNYPMSTNEVLALYNRYLADPTFKGKKV